MKTWQPGACFNFITPNIFYEKSNLLYRDDYFPLRIFGAKNNFKEWESLFDGNTLGGWKVGANASTFSVKNGEIVVHGPTAHLFYDGPYKNHDFKNFELSVDVMTYPGSNSGIYFHTAFQDSSWPKKGFEVQVNNSHTDWKRTGSLYNIVDVKMFT